MSGTRSLDPIKTEMELWYGSSSPAIHVESVELVQKHDWSVSLRAARGRPGMHAMVAQRGGVFRQPMAGDTSAAKTR